MLFKTLIPVPFLLLSLLPLPVERHSFAPPLLETAGEVHFDFSACRDSTESYRVLIKARLSNTGSDTVYFLSTTCDGDQYLLRFDTARVWYSPRFLCNASWTAPHFIRPHSEYTFQAYVQCRDTSMTSLTLGFVIFQGSARFLHTDRNQLPHIYTRPHTTLWAEEKTIE